MPELKNDRYRRERGGKAFFLELSCSRCNTRIMLYQKDGDGQLIRCYLNRIFEPPELERLQRDFTPENLRDMPALTCVGCSALLGKPFRYRDGRLAFMLEEGAVRKKRL